ncbi:MAG: hypothetical protein ABEJ31_15315 [Haloarculaceae archaeon]
MSSEPAGSDDVGSGRRAQEFTVTPENTFAFIPGPRTGIACPNCFRDQLLAEVIERGECTGCGAALELTISAEPAVE